MIDRLERWIHRLRHGHQPRWIVTGYDGLELSWGCLLCGGRPLGACPCIACRDWRADRSLSMGRTICFEELGSGHGICVDPWGIGCSCRGSSIDGDCEACWLWLK